MKSEKTWNKWKASITVELPKKKPDLCTMRKGHISMWNPQNTVNERKPIKSDFVWVTEKEKSNFTGLALVAKLKIN